MPISMTDTDVRQRTTWQSTHLLPPAQTRGHITLPTPPPCTSTVLLFPEYPLASIFDAEENTTLYGESTEHPGYGWVSYEAGVTTMALTIPHPTNGQAVPAAFQRYAFNGYAEPIIEGMASKHEAVWGEPL